MCFGRCLVGFDRKLMGDLVSYTWVLRVVLVYFSKFMGDLVSNTWVLSVILFYFDSKFKSDLVSTHELWTLF